MHEDKAMAGNTESGSKRRGSRRRIAVWGSAALILLLPLFAMEFIDLVAWDVADFAIFGTMLVGTAGTYELAARMTDNNAYRAAVGVALAAAFILVWMNLAVGIIGTEDDPANLMHGGVVAVGIIGAIIARGQPPGMARVIIAMALAQASVAAIAVIAGKHQSPISSAAEILGLNGIFIVLFLGSAWLFRRAAREHTSAGANVG